MSRRRSGPDFQRRVTLVGPESAGKTTLAETLAAKLDAGLIPEYGREYDLLFRQGAGWQGDDFARIIDGHLAMAGPIARASGPLVIEDTDPIQTLVWAEYLLGQAPSGLIARVERYALPSLYLLLGPQTEWHDDGTRYSGDQAVRRRFTDRLAYWLDRLGAATVTIDDADWPLRQLAAERAIAALKPPRLASQAIIR